MASYLILGAGKFGRLALGRLTERDHEARFLVVDHRPAALAAARTLAPDRTELVETEAVSYLAAHLGPEPPWDWLLPMVPVHLAYAWLLAGPLAGKGWEPLEVPAALEGLAPLAIRGTKGEIYLSRARHRCPDDCAEPLICPVTGEERPQPLFEELAAASLPELPVFVVASRQLAPGVGGFSPVALLKLAGSVLAAWKPLLVATACRCHGVVHGLKPQGERRV